MNAITALTDATQTSWTPMMTMLEMSVTIPPVAEDAQVLYVKSNANFNYEIGEN